MRSQIFYISRCWATFLYKVLMPCSFQFYMHRLHRMLNLYARCCRCCRAQMLKLQYAWLFNLIECNILFLFSWRTRSYTHTHMHVYSKIVYLFASIGQKKKTFHHTIFRLFWFCFFSTSAFVHLELPILVIVPFSPSFYQLFVVVVVLFFNSMKWI